MQFTFINIFAMMIDSLLIIPEMLHTVRGHIKHYQGSKLLVIADYMLKYGCIILMFLPLGVGKFGFDSELAMLIYLFGNAILTLVYAVLYVINIKRDSYRVDYVLMVIALIIFFLSGAVLRHYLLISCGIGYSVVHSRILSGNHDQYDEK